MNPVSAGCGDNVEDGKVNLEEPTTNPTGGWFWISETATTTNKKKMRTSQSTSSLQLFTIKSTKAGTAGARSDKGDGTDDRRDDVHPDCRVESEALNDDVVGQDLVMRRSMSLIDIATVDKDRMRDRSNPVAEGSPTMSTENEEVDAQINAVGGTLLRGFGDVGDNKDVDDQSASSVDSKEDEIRLEIDDVKRRAEVRKKDLFKGKRQDGRVDELDKIRLMEEKLRKSQTTMKVLNQANIGYQKDISTLKTTLEDESETRRVLQDELEASRKLCCELYENLLQERTKRRSSTEVERQLSPEALKFALSDAAVQTDVDLVENWNKKAHLNPLYSFENRENVSTASFHTAKDVFSQGAEIPRYGFYISHLLEEYQENQKNLEVQLKSLSEQCREKDEDLKTVKEKMGGHIRLNSMLQSEKVCLEETIEQLREEIKSCDHLLQSCDSVLKQKDREIRELLEAKYSLERRVAEFEFKEKEMLGMVSGFRDDIGDLASQRKKLRKCVKKSLKHESQKKQKEIAEEILKRSDEKEIELQAKAELLNAIREIAFRCSPSPTKPTSQLEILKTDDREPLKHQPKNTGDEAKRRYRARSLNESVVVMRESSVVVKKTSTCSISQASVLTDNAQDSELDAVEPQSSKTARDRSDEAESQNSAQQERNDHLPVSNERGLPRKRLFHRKEHLKGDGLGEEMKTKDVRSGPKKGWSLQQEASADMSCRSGRHGNASIVEGPRDEDDVNDEKYEVTSTCQNLYSDVMNELSCKNAAAALTAAPTAKDYTAMEQCRDVEDYTSLENAMSKDNGDLLHSGLSSDTMDELLDSIPDDFTTFQKNRESREHVQQVPTDKRKAMSCMDYSDDSISEHGDCDLQVFVRAGSKCYKDLINSSSNNSNESKYGEGSDLHQGEHSLNDGKVAKMADKDIETKDDLLSWDSPQQVAEMKEEDQSRCEISTCQSEDDSLDAELDFCVTDEDYDALELENQWQVPEDDSSETSSEFIEEPIPLRDGRHLGDISVLPGRANEVRRLQRERNGPFKSEQSSRMFSTQYSPDVTKAQNDVSTRDMKQSCMGPVDSGRHVQQRNNSPWRVQENTIKGSRQKLRENLKYSPSVRDTPHKTYYSSSEDTNDLHLGSTILDIQDTDSEGYELEEDCYGNASQAEGLILRKQVMENYATRANNRAWHYVYLTQDGSHLNFYKDRTGKELGAHIEAPLPLTNAIISVARDYFKRKHVFRVQTPNGQQYLFAAKDDREMMYWVCRLDAARAHPTVHHHGNRSHLPAAITTVPPPTNGSPTKSERLKNFIKGGISAMLK